MIVSWKGQTWGTFGTDFQVLAIQGIENRALVAANVSGGIDGAGAAPTFSDIGSFVVDLIVFADSDADMAANLAAIYAVTWGTTDRVTEDPFDFTIEGQDELTVFARVVNRSVPTDFETRDRYRACRMQIAYEATDPMVYGAEVEVTGLASGDDVVIAGGWAPSQRWRWIGHGALTNPRLTLATDGYDNQVLRYEGVVADGHDLLVESTPHSLVTTVDAVNKFDLFDGGTPNAAAQFFSLLPGQTLTYSAASGAGDASFRYRPARP